MTPLFYESFDIGNVISETKHKNLNNLNDILVFKRKTKDVNYVELL